MITAEELRISSRLWRRYFVNQIRCQKGREIQWGDTPEQRSCRANPEPGKIHRGRQGKGHFPRDILHGAGRPESVVGPRMAKTEREKKGKNERSSRLD